MATYLYKVLGTPTGTTKNTLSVWFKRSKLGADQGLVFANSNAGGINLHSDDGVVFYNAGGTLRTSSYRKLRDTSAWYHIVVTTDTTLSTADDRLKMYINGVQETNFSTRTNPSQNATSNLGTATEHIVGANNSPANYYDGLMSHVQMVDGLALAPTEFGSVDSTTGEWKISPATYSPLGNNGFHLTFENASDLGASTNSNNFTANANGRQTKDNPSNNFATMNPLIPGQTNYTYSNGNNTITQGSAAWVKSNSTLGMSSGKYYWEAKYVSGSYTVVGVDKTDTATPYPSTSSSAVGWKRNGNVEVATTPQTDIASYAHGDIVSVALDMDNACVYFGKGGVWQNSGDPTSGASKTGAYSLPSYVANTPYFATVSPYSSGATSMNFGNGYFGTTAVATNSGNGYAGTDGKSIFNYQPPTGYTALSTKGLNN